MLLYFVYPSGEYSIIQQYLVYGLGAFIADVGGYLVHIYIRNHPYFRLPYFSLSQGLCLGASLLTFYDLTVQALVKIGGKIRQMQVSKDQY